MNQEYLKFIKVEFMHGVEEPWCNNQGVAILPYVIKNNEYYYLLVIENNPLFKDKQISEYGTITGGLENLDPYQTVINEMLEETGIDVKNDKSKIYYLDKHYANKSSTKLWYFFSIDLTMLNLDLTKTYKGSGDGTEAEKDIIAKFISYEKICKSNDSLCLAIFAKWTFREKAIKEKAKQLFNFKNEILSDKFLTGIHLNEIDEENPELIRWFLPRENWQEFLKLEEDLNNSILYKLQELNNEMLISNSSNLHKNLKLQASIFYDKNKNIFWEYEAINKLGDEYYSGAEIYEINSIAPHL
ncbi:NUDIX hydrolase [Spiroplasma endosymbiont of Cleonymus obscurus]|uniref:NUDIX hydrolase n=1 Tax=Spiroplasma endosymbiont of Cleonymus obscurus TaxID=3066324 RepID=UPI0037DC81CA